MKWDVPSFLPIAAFHPRMICVLWGHSSHPLWLITFPGGCRESKKPLERQLRKAILAIGLVLRRLNKPRRVSHWWQIWSGTSTRSGQHTSMGSFTFCRLRNLCTTGRFSFSQSNFTFKHDRNQIQIQIQILKRSWVPLAKEQLQLQVLFESCKVVACACIIKQTLCSSKTNGITTF